MAWFKRLTEQGKAVAGNPLEREGKIVSGKNGRVVADGPFAESKEAIGGYFLLNVGSLDEAVAIAQQCPGLPYGAKVEVRPVMDAMRRFPAKPCPKRNSRKRRRNSGWRKCKHKRRAGRRGNSARPFKKRD